jgi:hypothetical protein
VHCQIRAAVHGLGPGLGSRAPRLRLQRSDCRVASERSGSPGEPQSNLQLERQARSLHD